MKCRKLYSFIFNNLCFYSNIFRWVVNRFYLHIDSFIFLYFGLCIRWLLWDLFDSTWYLYLFLLYFLYLLSTCSTLYLRGILSFFNRLILFCACPIGFEDFLGARSHHSLCDFPSNFIFVSRRNISRSKILKCFFVSIGSWQRRFFLWYNLRQFCLKSRFGLIFFILDISLPCLY